MTDSVSAMVAEIKNAYLAGKPELVISDSKFKRQILNVLVEKGCLGKVEEKQEEGKKKLVVTLKYEKRKPVLSQIRVLSRPGLRVYSGFENYRRVRGGMGLRLVTTSQGVMTTAEAFKKKLGGELILEVY